jgi:hypothetical protein
MLIRAALVAAIVVVVEGPLRFAVYAVILQRSRRTCPQFFDGPACAAAIAACLEEYQRELTAGAG